ncbi:MAG: helix-turn-helix domain-containing protein, partial [Ktedonobacteraceae bacterium]
KKEIRTAEPVVQPSATRLVTLEMYQKGMSIEEIAQERNLKSSTISSHIGELIEQGEIVDFERLIRPERYEVIVKAWQAVEGEALKPVKELLGEEYSYDEIRMVRSMMRCTR